MNPPVPAGETVPKEKTTFDFHKFDVIVPDIHDSEAFRDYHEKRKREIAGQLTEEEELVVFRNDIQQFIEKVGNKDKYFADIQDGKLVIINASHEVVFTWDESDPMAATNLCKYIGTGK